MVTFTYGLSDGAASDTAMVAVAVTTPASGADFVGDPLIGSAPLTVSFTDMSGGNPTTWSLR